MEKFGCFRRLFGLVFLFIYGGIDNILGWIPDSWGSYEDGHHYPIKFWVSYFLTVFTVMFLAVLPSLLRKDSSDKP
jgi:hypothetical protein